MALNVVAGFLLKIWYDKANTEQQSRLAIEEVYHNLAVEASKLKESTKVVTRYVEKPDGTKTIVKTETSKKVEEKTKVKESKSEKSMVREDSSTKDISKYSTTILGPLKYDGEYDYEQIGVYLGYRIFGPIEIIVGGRPYQHDAEVGVRFEW